MSLPGVALSARTRKLSVYFTSSLTTYKQHKFNVQCTMYMYIQLFNYLSNTDQVVHKNKQINKEPMTDSINI